MIRPATGRWWWRGPITISRGATSIRTRFAQSFKWIVSQRLVPKKGGGRIAVDPADATGLTTAENTFQFDLALAQGAPVDMGGYYQPDDARAAAAMRPSAAFNAIIDAM